MKIRKLAAMLTLLAMVAALMPLTASVAFGTDQGSGVCEDIYEPKVTHDWVRYKVQKSVWATGDPYNGPEGNAYWIAPDRVLDHDPLTINPLGNHDAPRIVGKSRFNVSGNGYVSHPEGTYFYKLVKTENETQPTRPGGEGWIDLGERTIGEKKVGVDLSGCEVTLDVVPACGSLSVTLESNVAATYGKDGKQYQYGIKIEGDGQSDTAFVKGVGSDTATLNFDEDAGGGEVEVTLTWTDHTETDFIVGGNDSQTFPVKTDCEPEEIVPFCLDINTATLDELIQVNGLDETLAQAVIDGRPYESIDHMVEVVKGIGPVSVLPMMKPDSETGAFISDDCLTVEPPDTTIPEETTTTTVPPTPTTEPEPEQEEPTTTTVPETTTTEPEETPPSTLPFTGDSTGSLAGVALIALVTGLGLVALSRKREVTLD